MSLPLTCIAELVHVSDLDPTTKILIVPCLTCQVYARKQFGYPPNIIIKMCLKVFMVQIRWYTINLYNTKIGPIFLEGQSPLHYFWMQSLLTVLCCLLSTAHLKSICIYNALSGCQQYNHVKCVIFIKTLIKYTGILRILTIHGAKFRPKTHQPQSNCSVHFSFVSDF